MKSKNTMSLEKVPLKEKVWLRNYMFYTKKSQNLLHAHKFIKFAYITNLIVRLSTKFAKKFGLRLRIS